MVTTKSKKQGPVVIDIDEIEIQPIDVGYQVYDEHGKLVREPGIRRASRRLSLIKQTVLKSGVPQLVGEGAKVTIKVGAWCVKQVLSLMVEGAKGVGSGIAASGSATSGARTRTKTRRSQASYIDNRSYTIISPSKKKKKPIWYIPSKEEEMMDNLQE